MTLAAFGRKGAIARIETAVRTAGGNIQVVRGVDGLILGPGPKYQVDQVIRCSYLSKMGTKIDISRSPRLSGWPPNDKISSDINEN